jgi:hypothetical protein
MGGRFRSAATPFGGVGKEHSPSIHDDITKKNNNTYRQTQQSIDSP